MHYRIFILFLALFFLGCQNNDDDNSNDSVDEIVHSQLKDIQTGLKNINWQENESQVKKQLDEIQAKLDHARRKLKNNQNNNNSEVKQLEAELDKTQKMMHAALLHRIQKREQDLRNLREEEQRIRQQLDEANEQIRQNEEAQRQRAQEILNLQQRNEQLHQNLDLERRNHNELERRHDDLQRRRQELQRQVTRLEELHEQLRNMEGGELRERIVDLRNELDQARQRGQNFDNLQQQYDELQRQYEAAREQLAQINEEELVAREQVVGATCFIERDLRNINFYPNDRFNSAEEFIQAIENKCVQYSGNLVKNENETDTQAITRHTQAIKHIITQSDLYRLIQQANPNLPEQMDLDGGPGNRPRVDITEGVSVLKRYLDEGFTRRYLPVSVGRVQFVMNGNNQPAYGDGLTRDFFSRIANDIGNIFTLARTQRYRANINADIASAVAHDQEITIETAWDNIGAAVAKIVFLEGNNDYKIPVGENLSYYLLNRMLGENIEEVEDWLALKKLDDPENFNSLFHDVLQQDANHIVDVLMLFDTVDDVNNESIMTFITEETENLYNNIQNNQHRSFIRGFHGIIPHNNLQEYGLNATTLALILGGSAQVDDLEGLIHVENNENWRTFRRMVIEIAREKINDGDEDFLRKLLVFWSGQPAFPTQNNLLSFSYSNTLRRVSLPRSQTCFNQLKVSRNYLSGDYDADKENFKQKLVQAVTMNVGMAEH